MIVLVLDNNVECFLKPHTASRLKFLTSFGKVHNYNICPLLSLSIEMVKVALYFLGSVKNSSGCVQILL